MVEDHAEAKEPGTGRTTLMLANNGFKGSEPQFTLFTGMLKAWGSATYFDVSRSHVHRQRKDGEDE